MKQSIPLTASCIVLFQLAACGGSDATDESARATPESVAAVESRRDDVTTWVFAQGTVRAKNREYLTFENAGRVEYIMPGPDGDELRAGTAVRQGQLLARQDQRTYRADLNNAETSVQQAELELQLAQQNQTRFDGLFERGSASQLELEEARSRVESAKAQLANARSRLEQAQVTFEETEIVAPMDGLLAYINIEEGFYFTPANVQTSSETAALESIPMVLIDTDSFEIVLAIPAFEMAGIEVGDRAMLRPTLAANRGDGASSAAPVPESTGIAGEVFSVNPAITPGSRSVQVKVRVEQPGRALQDGMFVSAWITGEEHVDAVVVPQDVLMYGENEAYVFVVDENGSARRRAVKLGLSGRSGTEVVSGLDAGECLVTEGRFRVSEGSAVRVIEPQSAGETGNANPRPSCGGPAGVSGLR